ncbi:MAG: hypothetical protein IJO43_03595 [Bacilli bacterium]|nr:hypothetical protein [Bacilli bacterium]
MNEFSYRITKEVYNWIINGTKNVEIRLYNEKSSRIKINDVINFKVLDDEEKNIKVVVKDLFIYNDIKSLLKDISITNIAPVEEEKLCDMLNDIFGEEKVKNQRIIGIKFAIASDKEEDVLIDLDIDKDPYVKQITDDKIINLTGQSGSGKSYYVKQKFNNSDYLVVDTDDILNEKRFLKSSGINRKLGEIFRKKYETLPTLGDNFDLIYKEILEYCKDLGKTIVIDCATFHCIKDINLLKGKVIVLRTSIKTCYDRCIERFKKENPNYTEVELNAYAERKKKIFIWYKYSNEFIKKLNKL